MSAWSAWWAGAHAPEMGGMGSRGVDRMSRLLRLSARDAARASSTHASSAGGRGAGGRDDCAALPPLLWASPSCSQVRADGPVGSNETGTWRRASVTGGCGAKPWLDAAAGRMEGGRWKVAVDSVIGGQRGGGGGGSGMQSAGAAAVAAACILLPWPLGDVGVAGCCRASVTACTAACTAS